jgi:Calx-beta domain
MTRVPRFFSLRLPLLALSVMALFAFGPSSQAQTKINQEMQVFTIVEAPDGSSLCRDATVQEKQRVAEARAQTSFKNLRLINHLGDLDKLSDGASASVNDGSLPGLKIFLLATARLEANPTAKAAFIKAAANWEQIIKTPMTVYIKVDVGPDFFSDGKTYSSGTIGSTSSFSVVRNFTDVRARLLNTASNGNETALYNLLPSGSSVPTDSGDLASVSVSVSIARALGILSANATASDVNMPQIGFNSAFNFDYEQSDGIAGGLVDFTAVATHEIGHALGFSSNSGTSSSTPRPYVLDLFRFRPGVTNFTTGQRIMTIGGGQQVFFAGATNIFTNGSPEAGLSTGGPEGSTTNGGDGRQSSHWRDDTPALGGFHYGIMDPTIGSGHREDITMNDLAAFNFLGYNLENSTLPPQPAGPANDNFAAAQTITGCSGTVSGTNVNATREAGEPSHSPDGNLGGASVWYQWQAPSTGSVTITTAGSDYDTLLAVYVGNSVGGLALLGRNDDVTSGVILSSSVTFNATAGTIYRIAVDGYDGNMGSLVLNWNANNCGVATPSVVQFNQASYAVNEGAGFAAITITRAGDASAPATVRYATSDPTDANFRCDQVTGVASRKCDYHIAAGKLRFAPGETTKQLTLSIINDVYVEGAETLTLTLSNPTGAVLGQNSIVPVTITDNDSAGAANPIDQTSFYVRQLYVDLLSREPDAAGLSGWTSRIDLCGQLGQAPPPCDRVTVGGDGFLRSGEFFDRQFFVLRLYRTGLGRILRYDEIADLAYVSGFLSDTDLELNKQDLVAEIMARAEFTSRYNLLDNTQFVDTLLQTAAVTVPADVRVAWITALNGGTSTRARVYREISERPEVSNAYAREAQVVSAYYGFFTRNPDGAYLIYLDRLNRGEITLGDLANAFINAAEYRSRFGQ